MSSRQGSGDSEKRQFWRLAVETWRGSGLSARRFCEVEGLSKAAFYFWRRQLARWGASAADGHDNATRLVRGRDGRPAADERDDPTAARGRSRKPAAVSPGVAHTPFIEVSIPRDGVASLDLMLTSGNVLRIGAAADTESLSRVVSVLHEAGLC